DPARRGQLRLTGGVAPGIDGTVETLPGDYRLFYAGVARALAGEAPSPVDAADVLWQLRVLEAALASAASSDVIVLSN
ncbi:MAG: hypothetical protein KC425_07830, partial [Anaerolineales bacterium]|nr:hypothetical protein [Anaerolineales bacterium]